MELITAKYAGFCFGVKRAVDAVFDLVEKKTGAHIYTVGSLIHNPNTNEKLAQNGVGIIREDHIGEDLDAADPCSVFVVRTHGVPLSVLDKLHAFTEKNPASSVLDMTCPFVAKIYKIMKENTSDETFTILIGNAKHPKLSVLQAILRAIFAFFQALMSLKMPLKKILYK